VARCGFPANIFERHYISDTHQLFFVDASNSCTDGRGQRFCAPRYRPDNHEQITHRNLSQRNIDLNEVFRFIRSALYLTDNTHNLAYVRRRLPRFCLSDGNPQADSWSAEDVATYESFIHQADGDTITPIAIIEWPTG
jgi:hypothetical protein